VIVVQSTPDMVAFGDIRDFPPTTVRLAVWKLFLAAMCAVTLFVAALSWNLRCFSEERAATAQALAHERMLRDLGEDLLATIACQREYLMTHDEKYLVPYETNAARARSTLETVRSALTEPPVRQDLDRLDPIVEEVLGQTANTVSLMRSGQVVAAMQAVGTGRVQQLMHEFRSVRGDLLRTQWQLLDQSRARINREIALVWALLVSGVAAALLVLYVIARTSARRIAIRAQRLF